MDILLESRALWASLIALAILPLAPWRWLVWVICLFLGSSLLASLVHLLANYFTGQGITVAVWHHLGMAFDPAVASQFWYLWLCVITAFLVLGLGLHFWGRVSINTRLTHLTWTSEVGLGGVLLVLSSVSVLTHPAVVDFSSVMHKRFQLRGPDLLAETLKGQSSVVKAITPKSFVYLYLESFERIFLDQERFPGLTPNLNRLFSQGVQVGRIYTAPMTGWTMAGMVSSQCGLPLSTAASVPASVEGSDQLTCLGDILNKEQYHLTYMGGADAGFSKKGRFYTSHGFTEVYGTEELENLAGRALPQSPWGVYDDDLLSMAYQKFESIASQYDRFGLVLLTLDTHQPSGHKTPSCKGLTYGDGESGMLNSVKCADRIVSRFIEQVLASEHAQDIVLIVGSDHLLMGNDAGIEEETTTRENLFYLFNVDQPSVVDRQATKFDLAPTILHSLGFQVGILNFGRNLFESQPTLSESFGRDEFNRLLYVWRNQLEASWQEE
ncbi:sulfatase-like hydrolase/transferase [Gilvimarinus agarilyticus]|uniref:sulfatase-like hydrolase/transferase n=1 Tax=Gilvimarinus sp. 2_MG-2023 TaxID=3062666 RepID=UPI001C08C3BF|nr:sulfatase-like hydrolase/transferase [Gilvimarinus sp. 2_MG-2023]MBU2885418.1 sulfatase-like hydrolase/transferase [Gilvimarinus agarilyticus]MDO6570318.1 sulfatase-like hydrolase/transferase [Gilvimarinus sp. 2_MG-2023]